MNPLLDPNDARKAFIEDSMIARALAESGANPSHASMATEIARLREHVRILRAPIEKFINKCDIGLAHSKGSYEEFKAALEATI